MGMSLDRFIDEFFASHPERREAFEAGRRVGREAGRKAALPFPNGRCANCGKPLDDHLPGGRCPT
jgi:hypothetical protein